MILTDLVNLDDLDQPPPKSETDEIVLALTVADELERDVFSQLDKVFTQLEFLMQQLNDAQGLRATYMDRLRQSEFQPAMAVTA